MHVSLVLGEGEYVRNERTLGRARVEEVGRRYALWSNLVLCNCIFQLGTYKYIFIETTKEGCGQCKYFLMVKFAGISL